jgi:hypothetical protein
LNAHAIRSGARSQRWVACAAFVAPLAACEPASHPVRTVIRDSAGITIVESSGRAWAEGEEWTVDAAPALDLTTSGVGEAHEFYRVHDAMILPNGDIAVGTGTEIRFFSASGEHLGTLGGEGDGPGEFRGVGRLGLLASDSLVAFDYWQRRVTVYGPDRELARVTRLDVDYLRSDRFAVFGDGFVLMKSWPSVRAKDAPWGLVRTPVPIITVSTLGQVSDTLALAAGYESVRIPIPNGMIDASALFGRDSYFAVRDDELIIGDAIDPEYHVLSAKGRLERTVRADYDLSLDPELLEAERLARLGESPEPDALRLFDQLPVPKRRPAYGAIQVDATGAVWLEEHLGRAVQQTSRDPLHWEVFGADGVWLGRVSLPGRFIVFEIGPDYVLGVQWDEMGVEHVQLLTLRR